ncbi:MAG: hypothetical protein Kow00109_15490 [Acidobacteriota bacterium]
MLLGLLGLLAPSGTATAADLDSVLRGMEKVGSELRSLKARIEQRRWTDLLQEYDAPEVGEFLFLKNDGKLFLRKEMEQPTKSVLVIADDTVTFYQPGIKQAQEYKLGRRKDRAEFLLLGFGTDREAIREAYDVSLAGTEEEDGRTLYHLVLEPKEERVAAFFRRIELWIDGTNYLPVRQKLVEPTEDHLLIVFSEIEANPRLRPSDFRLKLPKDVEIIRG